MADPKFNIRFYFHVNEDKRSERAPDRTLFMDFTPKDAEEFANYLKLMALQSELEGTTIKKWDAEKKEAVEVPGFSVIGSQWLKGKDEEMGGGSIKPPYKR